MIENRIFFKSTKLNTWEPVEFEDIKTGDKIKMVELSPNKDEVMTEIWDVTGGYNPKTGVFEGNQMTPAMYLPITKELKGMFEK